MIFVVLDVSWTLALTVIKLLSFFVLISLNTVRPKTNHYMPYLYCTVAHIFSVDYWRNIEIALRVVHGHWKLCHSKALVCFCRTLRCISAAYVVMRYLSVCPSVTFVDHVKTNKRIFKKFSPSGSQSILVFPYQTSWHYSDGDPLTGASNARAYEKMTIFDQYLALSPKWCKIEP